MSRLDVDRVAAGSPTLFETELVICGRQGPGGRETVQGFLGEFGVEEISFGTDHRRIAGSAFLRFGKGRHPAALNLGDCMSYSAARVAGEPLLCIGNDFARTDLELVIPGG